MAAGVGDVVVGVGVVGFGDEAVGFEVIDGAGDAGAAGCVVHFSGEVVVDDAGWECEIGFIEEFEDGVDGDVHPLGAFSHYPRVTQTTV